ncbi:MAG: tRNA (adenosine(37)-N6)-dimethylallyltransferase MiaA [Clostridia bacterium]|nr:tRNA (adenosine(37)-N6)-dimethylallyltransferase MiaA [Clostridia bacterium]
MKKIPLIVVGGPTASGKTALAIELAKALDGEIVSADSMQIYKYMDIGTAKPTADELKECPHHLIGFREPDCDFSVADYTELAHKTIADITARGKVAIMCGGTGLYINSVVNDVDFGEYENDYELRKSLDELAKKDGAGVLLDMLAEFDPVSAKRLHPNNVKRIIRAIEFYKVSGVPISEHQERTKLKESRYNATMFLINHNREVLYDRINRRVDIMISDGLVDEVRSIMNMGYSRDLNSMQGIGYKEMIAYLEGEISLADAIDMIKQNSRRYAKRQLTWFRRDGRINMLSPDDAVNEALGILKKVELQ